MNNYILNNISNIVIIFNKKGKILEISRSLPGINKSNIIGKMVFKIFSFPSKKAQMEYINNTINTGKKNSFETQYTYNQNKYYYKVNFNPIESCNEITGIFCELIDLTKEKILEEKNNILTRNIHDLNSYIKKINEKALKEINLIKHLNKKIMDLEHKHNERVKELSGLYNLSGIVDKYINSLDDIFENTVKILPPAWQYPEITCARIVYKNEEYKTTNFKPTRWKQACDIIVNGKAVGIIEVRYLKKMIDLYEGPFLKEERNLINAIAEGLSKIISRIDMHLALKDSEEQYRVFVDNASEAIVLIQNNIFKFTNRKGQEIFREKYDNLINVNILNFVHPDDKYIIKNKANELKNKPDNGCAEFRIITGKGDIRWIECNCVLINWKGKPAILGLMTDITEKKELHEQLINSEKLSTIGHLTSGIAHEFNNIMAVISLKCHLALMKIENKHAIIDNLQHIESQVEHAKKLVNDLNSFSRPSTPKYEKVKISGVIDKTFKLLREQLALENININKNYKYNPIVEIDSNKIQQVFLNLIINSRHAIKPKGAGNISVSIYKKDNNFIEIKISDDGKGISEKEQKNIFSPFYTTKGAKSNDRLGPNGSGLGLSIVYSIIKSHNGNISLTSREGHGTSFKIILPRNRIYNISENRSKKNKIENSITNTKILIVDDQYEICNTLSDILILKGYNDIIITQNSLEAINEFHSGDFKIVIMDIMMPGMNGIELYKKMKKTGKDFHTVFITGQSKYNNDTFIKDNNISVLIKPIAVNSIVKELKKIEKGIISNE